MCFEGRLEEGRGGRDAEDLNRGWSYCGNSVNKLAFILYSFFIALSTCNNLIPVIFSLPSISVLNCMRYNIILKKHR